MIAVAMAASSSWLMVNLVLHIRLGRHLHPWRFFLDPPRLPLHIQVGLGALTLLLQGIKKLDLVDKLFFIFNFAVPLMSYDCGLVLSVEDIMVSRIIE